jgi:hypothetical protein
MFSEYARKPITDVNDRLETLAKKYGTDKVDKCVVYDRFLSSIRNEPVNFFEIGIGGYSDPQAGGASLRMWKEYFAAGQIFGLDFYDKGAHAEDRICIYKGSQTDEAVLRGIANDIGRIDIILDDGSHYSEHVIKTFEFMFPLLASGGLYIVEDIGTSYWPNYGGSEDMNDPKTSVSFFKRLADGIQRRHFRFSYDPTYADTHTMAIHFYDNIIIVEKK